MRRVTLVILLIVSLFSIDLAFAKDAKQYNAPICAKCHEADTNTMRGFLENVSYRAKTILMNLLTHKEVVRFDEHTRVKNLESLEDMANYKGKGFRIHFVEEDGQKYAVLITRFDILKMIRDEDKLSKKDLKRLLAEREDIVLVDVRPPKKYMQGHIPGAINVPAPAFDKFKGRLPQDKSRTLVLYGVGGCLSPTVAVNAMAMGYTNVKIYPGGYPDWIKTEISEASVEFVKNFAGKPSVVIVDVRDAAEANKEHIVGAVSIPFDKLPTYRDRFPEKKKAPIVVYGQKKIEAARMIHSWGYKRAMYLPVSLKEFKGLGGKTETGPAKTEIVYVPRKIPGTVGVDEFKKLLASKRTDLMIIDVRGADEYKKATIKGAVNIPLDEMEKRLSEIPKDREVVLFCNTGVRAEMAYTLLKKRGFNNVKYLNGKIKFRDGNYEFEE